MSTYEPGTVAVVTWDNAPKASQRLGRSDVTTERAIYTTDDHWSLMSGWQHNIGKDVPTDVRPLVVLDLDGYDGERAVTYLRNLARESRDIFGESPSPRGKLANLIADQIEAQTKPPRIPEPGRWGVVSVENRHGLTDYWTRGYGGWFSESGHTLEWASLTDPTLVRPGIEESS